MASDDVDSDMQNLVDEVAEKCLQQLRSERVQADQNQLEQINALLEHWSEQSFERTRELVLNSAPSGLQAHHASSSNGFAEAAGDMRDRQSNLLAVSSSHNSQLQRKRQANNSFPQIRPSKSHIISNLKYCVPRSLKRESSLRRRNWYRSTFHNQLTLPAHVMYY